MLWYYGSNYLRVTFRTIRSDTIKLYPHQEKTLQQLSDFNKCALYLDMGLGKTYTGSVKATSFEKPILIVCPKSTCIQWLEHFENVNSEWTLYALKKKKQIKRNKLIKYIKDRTFWYGLYSIAFGALIALICLTKDK